jgi:hypothetical protein
MAKAADGAELSIERGFKYGENRILEIIRHGGAPEHGSRIVWHAQVCLSIEINIDRRTMGSAVHLLE